MKLNAAQVEQALSQFNAQALPDTHPVVPQLNDLFGEHTFFLDKTGLNVLESLDPDPDALTGTVVNVASWADPDRTSLAPHDPEPTDIVVVLERQH